MIQHLLNLFNDISADFSGGQNVWPNKQALFGIYYQPHTVMDAGYLPDHTQELLRIKSPNVLPYAMYQRGFCLAPFLGQCTQNILADFVCGFVVLSLDNKVKRFDKGH